MKKVLSFFFALCFSFCILITPSFSESSVAADTIPEPTLSPNAPKYDPDHLQ